jgi:hypothetical protein
MSCCFTIKCNFSRFISGKTEIRIDVPYTGENTALYLWGTQNFIFEIYRIAEYSRHVEQAQGIY